MEIFTEGFCALKYYKSASKKLKSSLNLSKNTVAQFVQYVKKTRNKRKSNALSFDVRFILKINFDLFSDKHSWWRIEVQNFKNLTEKTEIVD